MTNKSIEKNNTVYEAVVKTLCNENNKYFLTLAPRKGFDIESLERSLNHLFMLMNEHLYGKRYKNQGNYIHGVAVLEHAEKDNPHFHILIRDPNKDLESKYSFKEILDLVLPRIKVSLSDKSSRRLISENTVDIQDYYNDGSDVLEHYMAKEYLGNEVAALKKLRNISPLNINGVTFGEKQLYQ